MRIIAVSNIKGGVGKTTTAVNRGYQTAASGRPAVIWDFDPQGTATFVLRCGLEIADLVASTAYVSLELVPDAHSAH
jgi:chromosome partitioning protein